MSAQSSGTTPQTISFTPSRTSQIVNRIPFFNAKGMIAARDRQHLHDTSPQRAGDHSKTLSNDEAHNGGELRIDRRRSKAPQTVSQTAMAERVGEAATDKRGTTNGVESNPASTGSRRPLHHRQHSVGSSPLAQEVVNSQQGDVDLDRITAAAPQPKTTESTPSSATSIQSNSSEIEKRKSAIGYDTDPAQIVNLALNLSESRRRNISGGGFLLPGLPYSNSGGSLRQHLQQQRHASGNTSPRSRNTSGSPRLVSTSSRQRKSTPIRSPTTPMLSEELGDDHILVPSDATLTRVAKAKEAFELFYEYRRLLPHLSAIPVSARKGSSGSTRALSPTGLGRVYNPLQYVRNRRIRLNERNPLNAEAAGWRDVARVRNWVDRIIDEREDGLVARDQQNLPPFEGEQLEAAPSDGADGSVSIPAKVPRTQDIGRPDIDWTFFPWDLLADVRWLEEDDHFKRIRDSSGQNIFAQMVNHADSSPRASRESARDRRPHANASGLYHSPERRQAIAAVKNQERQMPNSKGSSPSSPISERGRKARWTRGFIRSREPSLSDDSDTERRRKLKRNNKRADREHLANIALEKQMMDMLAREEVEAQRDSKRSMNSATERISPKAFGREKKAQDQLPTPERRRPSGPQRLKTDMPIEKHITPRRSSFDERRFERRMSSDDFSPGPSLPTANGYVPSIAINLSPPRSPNSTTTVPKPFAKVAPFRRGRSPSGSTANVDKHDFAPDTRLSFESSRSNIGTVQSGDSNKIERTATNESRLLSPIKTITGSKKSRLHESHSFRSLKDLNEPEGDSKLRSFLKGGRLAELVGNQVARAGEMLWKKDGASGAVVDSPTASHASTDSDVDDADLSALDNSPSDLSRVTTNADGHVQLTRMTTSSEMPKYFMNNLPSFRSPYRDEGPDKSPKSSPALDPISRQQRDRKARSRSSRFDRLAPPKIDMRSVSPSPSPSGRRARSTSSQESSPASVNRSRSRVSSHSMLNDMLGIPGQAGTLAKMPAPTGLASFKAQTESSSQRPQLEGNRQWSISDRSMSTSHGPVSKPDIARVRALMLSSGVKANEITRRSEETPKKPSKLLQDLGSIIDGPLPCVPESQEHVIAARMLINFIESTNDHIHEAEKQFAGATVQNLSRDIGAIEQRINASLSPMVRDSADGADALSIEVTTTHTLAVKQIGDRIDLILRRRRQTSRWLRRRGWAMLEWAVLGMMWMVWFVVVIIRIIRGIGTGFVGALRWLLWL